MGNWLAVDKVIAKIIWLTFLAHPVFIAATYTVYNSRLSREIRLRGKSFTRITQPEFNA